MKYESHNITVPQERREDINNKILAIIDGKAVNHDITEGDIFNSFTGKGGLHGLDFDNFDNYHQFSEAKKGHEKGQFFTPAEICRDMVQLVKPGISDLICDPTCGSGNFFNYLPVEQNCYGCELDPAAAKVAKHLYPDANIIKKDIQDYNPGVNFDYIFGNPPFNLKLGVYNSQHFFCVKAAELLKPGGFLVLITPVSFLNDDFMANNWIEWFDREFNFIFQYQLDPAAFRSLGVDNFKTKVMVFRKKSKHLEDRPYCFDVFVEGEVDQLFETHIKPLKEIHREMRAKIILESRKDKGSYDYKVNKLLYQIRINKKTAPFYGRCVEKVEALKTQQQPDDMTREEWNRKKLTENKVLFYLKRTLKKQHQKETDKIAFVKQDFGFAVKAYSRKEKVRLSKLNMPKRWNLNDLILASDTKPLTDLKAAGISFPAGYDKLVERKVREFGKQSAFFDDLPINEEIDRYLNAFRFIGKDGQDCRFNDVQKKDLARSLQKRYSLLNWEMGSGKTAAAYAWAKYNMTNRFARNIFIISAAISIEMTWISFMQKHSEDFIVIKSLADIQKIKPGMFVLVSLSRLRKTAKSQDKKSKFKVYLYKYLRDYIKRQSYKVALIFDESDEITNPKAIQSKDVVSCFRKVKYKLLATGTTTRNNITELYKQLELLYNNSINMLCECETIYSEVKGQDGDVGVNENKNVDYFNKPFSAKLGNNLFKSCFNPCKKTVFGIKKNNQDIFNMDRLIKILKKTILTRRFKEIAGPDKYEIKSHKLNQNRYEVLLYGKIINELQTMIAEYFSSTGNERKDQMLQIIRQIQLLIKATSTPQTFKEYRDALPPAFPEELQKFPLFRHNPRSQVLPNKYRYIEDMVKARHNRLVAVGCTTHDAAHMYYNNFCKKFPERKVFLCLGSSSFKQRNEMLKEFEASKTGILIATQQSLKSSVNIPTCNEIIVEALPWNVPKLMQFCFRFIRYDSTEKSYIHIVNYENTIDMNLFALLLAKERINDFIKTLEFKDQSDIYGEFDVNLDILESILSRTKDHDGKVKIEWGLQKVS